MTLENRVSSKWTPRLWLAIPSLPKVVVSVASSAAAAATIAAKAQAAATNARARRMPSCPARLRWITAITHTASPRELRFFAVGFDLAVRGLRERSLRRPSPDLEHQRHRAVVDEGHGHAGPEDALLSREPLAEAVVQRLRHLRPRRLDVAGSVALASVAIEGELADAEDLPLAQRLVHPALGVVEDPQRPHLVGEAGGLLLPVAHADPEQHQHPRSDLGHPLALDVDRRLADPLDERPQVMAPASSSSTSDDAS